MSHAALMSELRTPRLAVLIDADNTSAKIAAKLFTAIRRIGEPSVARMYGDFSNPSLKSWKDISSTYALLPHLALPNTPAKNATDIALVIEAMDLLHSGRFDAFCLVSSDSDLTRLASRIREQGLDVYGFGKAQTPASFQNACKRFYDTESFEEAPTPPMNGSVKSPLLKQSPSAAARLIRKAANELSNDEGWAHLGAVGDRLSKLFPGFQSKTYGCSSLKDLVAKTGAFEIKGDAGAVYIRAKSGGRNDAPGR
jgi:hypothetical protein